MLFAALGTLIGVSSIKRQQYQNTATATHFLLLLSKLSHIVAFAVF
jgi:hypothetical protein